MNFNKILYYIYIIKTNLFSLNYYIQMFSFNINKKFYLSLFKIMERIQIIIASGVFEKAK